MISTLYNNYILSKGALLVIWYVAAANTSNSRHSTSVVFAFSTSLQGRGTQTQSEGSMGSDESGQERLVLRDWNAVLQRKQKKFLQEIKGDLVMVCHNPPLKNKETPLPILSPIPFMKCRDYDSRSQMSEMRSSLTQES